jgi:hypothetical protein
MILGHGSSKTISRLLEFVFQPREPILKCFYLKNIVALVRARLVPLLGVLTNPRVHFVGIPEYPTFVSPRHVKSFVSDDRAASLTD